MTALADTAQIPRVGSAPHLDRVPPPIRLLAPVGAESVLVVTPPAALCRADVTAERKALRHSRRMWGLAGLSVLAVSLGATVTVLDVFH